MRPWQGLRVLITSGPTREYLDPVRFMTNASSGRMGWALAREARDRGASVTVVTGPCVLRPLSGVRTLSVVSALQMYRRVLAHCHKADVVIAAAAVSDWRFPRVSRHKLKRSGVGRRLTLVPNPDIIKEVGRRRRRRPPQVLVGFALETRRAAAAARDKMLRKGLDLIVANGPASLGSGRIRLTLLGRRGLRRIDAGATKRQAARLILREAFALLDL